MRRLALCFSKLCFSKLCLSKLCLSKLGLSTLRLLTPCLLTLMTLGGCGAADEAPSAVTDVALDSLAAADVAEDVSDAEDVSVAQDVTADAASARDTATADAPSIDDVAPEDVEQPLALVSDGYEPGGLLARQYSVPLGAKSHALDVDLPPEDGSPATLRATWLVTKLDFSPEAPLWSAPWQPENFYAADQRIDLSGAIDVPAPVTSVTIGVAAVGSVVVEAAGETILDVRDVAQLQVYKLKLDVAGPGWLPLKIRYVPKTFSRHLQVWIDRGQGLQALSGQSAGYVDKPEGANKVTHELVWNGYWKVKLSVKTTQPSRVAVQDAKGTWLVQDSAQKPQSQHTIAVPVVPGSVVKLKLRVRDVWGNEQWIEVDPINAKLLPQVIKGGLFGEYFADLTFTKKVMRRVDEQIQWKATYSSFDSLAPKDKFTVRWNGGFLVPKTGTYTIYFGTDDGQRVWLDGEKVVEDWVGHGTQYSMTTASLAKGWHVLELHHYDSGGHAAALLEWEGPGIKRQPMTGQNLGFPVLKPEDEAPKATTKAVKRVDAKTVQVTVGLNVLATVKAKFLPLPGQATETVITLPADSFVRTLPTWGPGAGSIELQATSLTGKTGPVIKLLVPGQS